MIPPLSPPLAFGVTGAVALASCSLAVVSDLRTQRIPNRLTASTALAGLALNTVLGFLTGNGSGPGVLSALAGGAMGLLLFLPLSLCGAVGFGDTKLVAALGLCIGFPLVLRMVVCTMLAGGVLALARGLAAGHLGAVARNVIRCKLASGRIDGPHHRLHTMPYALAIAVGTLWALASRYLPVLGVL